MTRRASSHQLTHSLNTDAQGTVGFTDVDVTDTAALEAAIKGMGKLQGLAYCVGSIALKPLKATTTDDFIKVCVWEGGGGGFGGLIGCMHVVHP
jgi:hypothetical protein